MKIQVRQGVFETNSSSTHSITMCSAGDFNKWKEGKLIYDRYGHDLITIEEAKQDNDFEADRNRHRHFLTYDEFMDDWYEYETYSEKYTTPGGETVYAFGYFGYDG